MMEFIYHHFSIPNDIMDLGNDHQQLAAKTLVQRR